MFMHGIDKKGHPCITMRSKELHPDDWTLEEFVKNYKALMQYACKLAD